MKHKSLIIGRLMSTVEALGCGWIQIQIGDEVICRFRKDDLVLDVMPAKEEVLSFSNRWYEDALNTAFAYNLPNYSVIKVISAPYFLCTKFEAYEDRGASDEKDLEDIVNVIDGRSELSNELKNSEKVVREYLGTSIRKLINDGFLSKLDWFLPQDPVGWERTKLVEERIQMLSRIDQ